MIDRKLTEQLQQWLNTPAAERDKEIGAKLIRQLVRNPIFADNFKRMPNKYMKMAEYQLSKFLPLRLAEITHEDVQRMTKKVASINAEHQLDKPLPGAKSTSEKKRIEKTEAFQVGKRPDHDSLPEEIQSLYKENLSIMQNMRACHAQLILLTLNEKHSSCPDGDRYPFVKEIIDLDARYHANWQKYDEYPPVE